MLTVFSWQQLKNQQDIVCFNLMFHFDVCHCKKREFQLLSWICGGSSITASGLLLRVTYLLLWCYCNVLSSVTIGWPSSGISAHTHCSLQEVIPSSTLCTYLICYTLPHKKISTWLYHSSYCRTRLPAAIIFSHLIVITKPDSLFEDDLGGSLAVHAEVPIGQLDDSAHWLPDRIEGVDFVKLLFRDLVSYWLVIPLQVQDQSQQAALCLVAHLLWQTAFLVWGLEKGEGRDFWMFRSIFILIFGAIDIRW